MPFHGKECMVGQRRKRAASVARALSRDAVIAPLRRTLVLFATSCIAFTHAAHLHAQERSDEPAIRFNLAYAGAGVANLAGGVNRRAVYTSDLETNLTLDLARVAGWDNALIYIDASWTAGSDPSGVVGDAQGISNISARTGVRLEELWLQKNFSHV